MFGDLGPRVYEMKELRTNICNIDEPRSSVQSTSRITSTAKHEFIYMMIFLYEDAHAYFPIVIMSLLQQIAIVI